jgi:putative ABC transport system substrate-binding protein
MSMRRREFIGLLGGAATIWPLAARAQQPALPVIGFLHSATPDLNTRFVATFREALSERGYVDGRNTTIDFRWAEGQYNRLPALAADLVRRQPAVIVAFGPPAAMAAKAATATVPVVFTAGVDPVGVGLVASLNRPGGNVTGIYIFAGALEAKRLELLSEMIPRASLIAVLVNPADPQAPTQVTDTQAAATALGRQTFILNASSDRDFDAVFATIVERHASALLVSSGIFFGDRRKQLVALAARHNVPAIYEWRESAADGGLMSYGANFTDLYRQAGNYAGQILAGRNPADLPVMQSTKFELVINLKTAKALGLTVPPTLLARADEVIE